MCARSQQSGDMSSDTWRIWSRTGTGSRIPSVRRRAPSSAATISVLVTTSAGDRDELVPVVELVVGGGAPAGDEPVVVLGGRRDGGVVGADPGQRVPCRGEAAPGREPERGVGEPRAGGV